MAQEFNELFGTCFSQEELKDSFANARVLSIDFDRKQSAMSCEVIFPALIKRSDIFENEQIIVKKLGLSSFSIHPKYTPDLFSADYFSEIVALLKKRVSVVNGYFDNSTAEYNGNT